MEFYRDNGENIVLIACKGTKQNIPIKRGNKTEKNKTVYPVKIKCFYREKEISLFDYRFIDEIAFLLESFYEWLHDENKNRNIKLAV